MGGGHGSETELVMKKKGKIIDGSSLTPDCTDEEESNNELYLLGKL